MKVAITFSYLGNEFHGSQIQPLLDTVQGELEKACERLKWSPNGVKISSRTDAGVNARMNFALIDVPEGIRRDLPQGLLKGLNDLLPPSICAYDAEEVSGECNIRAAKTRTYRYRLDLLDGWSQEYKINDLEYFLNFFTGEHDFVNFYKQEDDRSTIRIIDEISPWTSNEGRIIGFEIRSRGFLWNQVRRIANCIVGLLKNNYSESEVLDSLKTEGGKYDFGLAPSRWLTLWHIEHEEISTKLKTSFYDPPSISNLKNDRRVNAIIVESEAKKHHAWLQQEFALMLKLQLKR